MDVVCKSVYCFQECGDLTKIIRTKDGVDAIYFVGEDSCTCRGFEHRGKCRHLSMVAGTFNGDYLSYAEFVALNTFLIKERGFNYLEVKPRGGYEFAQSIGLWQVSNFEDPKTDKMILDVKVGKKKFVVYILKGRDA